MCNALLRLDWIWLGWVGLGWARENCEMSEFEKGIFFERWIGFGWVGLDWVGLGWVGLGWIGLSWIGLSAGKLWDEWIQKGDFLRALNWIWLGWIGLGWAQENCEMSEFEKRIFFERWIGFSWVGLDWVERGKIVRWVNSKRGFSSSVEIYRHELIDYSILLIFLRRDFPSKKYSIRVFLWGGIFSHRESSKDTKNTIKISLVNQSRKSIFPYFIWLDFYCYMQIVFKFWIRYSNCEVEIL